MSATFFAVTGKYGLRPIPNLLHHKGRYAAPTN
jgi:hypothetical protein